MPDPDTHPAITAIAGLESSLGLGDSLSLRLRALWFLRNSQPNLHDGGDQARLMLSTSALRDHLGISTSGTHRLIGHLSDGYRDGVGRDQSGAGLLRVELIQAHGGNSHTLVLTLTEKGRALLASLPQPASPAAEALKPAGTDNRYYPVPMTDNALGVILSLTSRCGGPEYSFSQYRWNNPDNEPEEAATLTVDQHGSIVALRVCDDIPDFEGFVELYGDVDCLVVAERGGDGTVIPYDPHAIDRATAALVDHEKRHVGLVDPEAWEAEVEAVKRPKPG